MTWLVRGLATFRIFGLATTLTVGVEKSAEIFVRETKIDR